VRAQRLYPCLVFIGSPRNGQSRQCSLYQLPSLSLLLSFPPAGPILIPIPPSPSLLFSQVKYNAMHAGRRKEQRIEMVVVRGWGERRANASAVGEQRVKYIGRETKGVRERGRTGRGPLGLSRPVETFASRSESRASVRSARHCSKR
jgi:hypothetical protein